MTDEELQKLVENYQPNNEVLNAVSQVRLLATVGPSASGKSTIMKALVEKNPSIRLVLADTERPRRQNEEHGVDLIFRPRQDILDDLKNGQLLQAVLGPNGHIYCTRPDSFPKEGVGVLPLVPAGVRQFRQLPLASFTAAFIVPDSYEHWRQWLDKQASLGAWTPQQLKQRLEEAKQSHEFALNDSQIHFVLNDDVATAANRLLQVSNGQKPDDEEKARATAEDNYKKLLAQN